MMSHTLWLGLTVLFCGAQFVRSQSDFICNSKENGTLFDSDNGCFSCMCINDTLQCHQKPCPALFCPKELHQKEEGECCPSCESGCYSEKLGFIKPGESKTSKDECFQCQCTEDSQISCLHIDCAPCSGHWSDDGSCCGHCDMNKCLINDVVYENGDTIESDNPCETCHCVADGEVVEVMCYMMACAYCQGIWTDDGTCCGKCEMARCEHEGKQYNVGEGIPSDNPCEQCYCADQGFVPEVVCAMAMCAPCRGKTIDDGSCCGKCEPGCNVMGELYDIDQEIPSDNPCEHCFCADQGSEPAVVCAMAMCAQCLGRTIDDGSCCGKCEPGCNVNGELYDIGIEVPSKSPCEVCMCEKGESGSPEILCTSIACAARCGVGFELVQDGNSCCGHCQEVVTTMPVCDVKRCPKPNCPSKMQVVPPGGCCPECKCKYKRKTINPGPFGDKCDGCVCENGRVICSPPKCPEKVLECVDAELGEDCCYHCPNGKTCAPLKIKGKVIKYGEYVKVKGDYCTCSGDPWHPIAFCAKSKVPRSLLKKFGKQVADYMILK